MKLTHIISAYFILANSILIGQESRQYKIVSIAFYNVENLFDLEDDPLTYDDDRTPTVKDHWTEAVYAKKINNIARVLSEIGADVTSNSPILIGLCEIENRQVLESLINHPALSAKGYEIIHFDSPDRRGIDVAFLYQSKIFTPTGYKKISLELVDENEPTRRIYTRDQLLVSGMLEGEKIHIIVNHWPSRSGGEKYSRPKRLKAARLNKQIIDSLFTEDPYAKIITMGDLNDDPSSQSVMSILGAMDNRENMQLKELFNPMAALYNQGLGTLAWRDSWSLFDQIIISAELTKKEYESFRYYKVGIYNPPYLITSDGRYKGYPFRSYTNGNFTGGYSDHFPVYIYLIKEKK